MKQALSVVQGLAVATVVTAELVYLGLVLWRQVDPQAPELGDLIARGRQTLETRAQYEAAIRRTVAQIRRLPETTDER